MPPAAGAGRGKRGVAPIGGWSDERARPRPGALQAQVARGKRERDAAHRSGPRDVHRGAGAGRGRGRRQAHMNAAAWRAMTEGADDPLLEGEETGLSLALGAEESEASDVSESEEERPEEAGEWEQAQTAVAALESELAEAARKEMRKDSAALPVLPYHLFLVSCGGAV